MHQAGVRSDTSVVLSPTHVNTRTSTFADVFEFLCHVFIMLTGRPISTRRTSPGRASVKVQYQLQAAAVQSNHKLIVYRSEAVGK